jgi:GT2 family glycosyltransferase
MAAVAFREGRLSSSPGRWLVDLRHLRGLMQTRAAPVAAAPVKGSPLPASPVSSANLVARARAALATFLRDGNALDFVAPTDPLVSVLLILHNRAELTFRCLESLASERSIPLELIIFDNASSDETRDLLDHVRGARIVRSHENVGFLRGCNRAAEAAQGQYLLFLNNDTELSPGSLAAALDTIMRVPSVGAVGGRLVFPDGRLQEAGSIIWNDGSCLGYGRGDSPWKPEYSFERDVDFCSAAFLLTPRRLFSELGGFDGRYQPAYYEDADYCVRLWKSGSRVVYEPRALVTHFEFASASATSASMLQHERRSVFVNTHRDWLVHQASPSPRAVWRARARPHRGGQLIFVEDRVPHRRFGAGYPRALEIVHAARELGYRVTLYPLVVPDENWADAYSDLPRDIELMLGAGEQGLPSFLKERLPDCDVLLVSRPHNMQVVASVLSELPALSRPPLVYDAEAIFACREVARRRLLGKPVTEQEERRLVAEELALARISDAVLTVSELDRQQFLDGGLRRVIMLGHSLTPNPTPSPFESRDVFLFVGAITDGSPNADSVRWLARDLLPRLAEQLGRSPRLRVAGRYDPSEVSLLSEPGLEMAGIVDDLTPLYDTARVFLAPTRFAAGLPLKVMEAAAFGVPVVCTSLVARQLGWRDNVEVLVADTADDFAARATELYRDAAVWSHLREAALARVVADCSPTAFRAALARALNEARHTSRVTRAPSAPEYDAASTMVPRSG